MNVPKIPYPGTPHRQRKISTVFFKKGGHFGSEVKRDKLALTFDSCVILGLEFKSIERHNEQKDSLGFYCFCSVGIDNKALNSFLWFSTKLGQSRKMKFI